LENLDKNRLDEAFVDVRKAYRLLANYQKRVRDLAGFIGEKLGFRFSSAYPMFSGGSPNKEKESDLNRWSWDWLVMYFYQFHFGKKMVGSQELEFAIFVQADTGYFESQLELSFGERQFSEKFKDPNDSKTLIHLVVGYKKWNGTPWWTEEFNESFKGKESSKVLSDENGVLLMKSYELSLFYNEDSTVNQLTDFKDFCSKNGIYIEKEKQL
jgi:hypothetical protein